MKQTVDFQTFSDTFSAYDRADNFSREGLELLFGYLEDYEDQTGTELELDVIALCCDYNEDTPDDIIQNYTIDVEGMDDAEQLDAVREYLEENTQLIGETASSFIYACF